MFGFMGTPCRSCAGNKTHSSYRGFFCGLSSRLSQDYTPAARFLVNRDSTFLSLMGATLGNEPPVAVANTCCNPISIPKPLFQDGLHVQYAAAVTICGLATKLEDDRQDEKGLRRISAALAGKAVSSMKDRAISFLNTVHFPTAEVMEAMHAQEAVERGNPDLMTAAEPTAHAYGKIFQHAALISGEPSSGYGKMGEKLGRLIYWRDAFDDQKEDLARGRFNPLQRSSEEELREAFAGTTEEFCSEVNASPMLRFQDLISQVLATTMQKHRQLLPAGMMANVPVQQDHERAEKERNRQKKGTTCCEKDWCCCPDTACCCSEGLACGSCSCGNAGSESTSNGSDCCNCDGCDCCPGN